MDGDADLGRDSTVTMRPSSRGKNANIYPWGRRCFEEGSFGHNIQVSYMEIWGSLDVNLVGCDTKISNEERGLYWLREGIYLFSHRLTMNSRTSNGIFRLDHLPVILTEVINPLVTWMQLQASAVGTSTSSIHQTWAHLVPQEIAEAVDRNSVVWQDLPCIITVWSKTFGQTGWWSSIRSAFGWWRTSESLPVGNERWAKGPLEWMHTAGLVMERLKRHVWHLAILKICSCRGRLWNHFWW